LGMSGPVKIKELGVYAAVYAAKWITPSSITACSKRHHPVLAYYF